MIERIEALCERLAPNKWPSVEDHYQARQLLPLMLEVVKTSDSPQSVLANVMDAYDAAWQALDAYCADHLPKK